MKGIRKEIKGRIFNADMTMREVVELLAKKYGWSRSASNFSDKLRCETIRYREILELADVLGYDLIWKRRKN